MRFRFRFKDAIGESDRSGRSRMVRWWRGLDSNQRRLSQRIYSPSPLATRAPLLRSFFSTGTIGYAPVTGRRTSLVRAGEHEREKRLRKVWLRTGVIGQLRQGVNRRLPRKSPLSGPASTPL